VPRVPLVPGSAGAAIVREEQLLLARVEAVLGRHGRAAGAAGGTGRPAAGAAVAGVVAEADYDRDLIELRDAIGEAKPEDIPPLVEQMARLAALAGRRRDGLHLPVDPASPYFAHLRLREPVGGGEERVRDVLIGRRGLIDRDAGVQIVDWRDAPVSQLYYRYEEGDDYDEQVGKRHLEGVIEARRNVTIHDGALQRIGCPGGVFVAEPGGGWAEVSGASEPTLAGGQGQAARPPRPAPVPKGARRPGFVPAPRPDKHLPEIAALIDPVQFELITAPDTGVVVIQGGAGSGKTTVALHRVAWLVFHDPKRYRPRRCLVIVPTVALERYVAGVLPSLGVHGVPVLSFARWARHTRRRLLPAVPDRYAADTPAAVTRVKKHPALLPLLERFVAGRAATAAAAVVRAAASPEVRERVAAAWAGLPAAAPVPRLLELRRWLGRAAFELAERRRVELEIGRALRTCRDVASAWAEALTDAALLRAALPVAGPDPVTDGDVAELVRWVTAQLEERGDEEADEPDEDLRAARTPVDGGDLDDGERGRAAGRLDPEDDALLLRLCQLLLGGLARDGVEAPLTYDHVALDEAQDLAALEVAVLVGAVEPRGAAGGAPIRSVTLAGDVAQRLVFDNAFHGWEALCAHAGVTGRVLAPLALSYRSTAPVMRFARAVLGPLATADPPAARPGEPVELHHADSLGEAVMFLAEALRSLAVREPGASVALIARFPAQADVYHDALRRAEVPAVRRVSRQDFSFSAGVDVTDVAQVKGLEFDYVVLLDVTASSYPDHVEARHLLHIAATRAVHQLWLLAVGELSPLLPADLGPAAG
jgi:DNA helicase-2/ATP-dependent DNA helicase PcrA